MLYSAFLTRLLTSGILFSRAVRAAVVVAKLVILGILALTPFSLVLRVVLVAKLVVSGILSSIFLILALYPVFLTTSFFTTLLSLLKSTGVVSNFAISQLSTLFFKLLKLVGTLFNLLTSILSTSTFKLTRSDFHANLDVLIPVVFSKSDVVA